MNKLLAILIVLYVVPCTISDAQDSPLVFLNEIIFWQESDQARILLKELSDEETDEALIYKGMHPKEIARRVFLFDEKSEKKKLGWLLSGNDTLHITHFDENGIAINPMWICIDPQGEILLIDSKLALSEPFDATYKYPWGTEKSKMEEDLPHANPKPGLSRTNVKIFPCGNCKSELGKEGCSFIW